MNFDTLPLIILGIVIGFVLNPLILGGFIMLESLVPLVKWLKNIFNKLPKNGYTMLLTGITGFIIAKAFEVDNSTFWTKLSAVGTVIGALGTIAIPFVVLHYQKQREKEQNIQREQDLIIGIWKESLEIFHIANRLNIKEIAEQYHLNYFALFIYFERACAIFYTLKENKSKDLFYRLFDDTIEYNLRKHLAESLQVIKNKNCTSILANYGYKCLAWYVYELNIGIKDGSRKLSHQIDIPFEFNCCFWNELKKIDNKTRYFKIYNDTDIENCKKQYKQYMKDYEKEQINE